MAERLGEALLDLRTNDAGFTQGVAQAEGRAQKLGQTLDRTKGSSAQLAGEMLTTGRSAAQMGAGFEQAGRQVTQSAGAQRQGLQQLSFQLNDAATMFALGARPMQIFASQSGQVIQAVQMMTGGTSRLAMFLGGPWGLALTSAAVVLAPFIGKLFETEQALGKVEMASDRLADTQSILGRVFDLTTGKLKDQTAAAIENAKALQRRELLNSIDAERKVRTELEGTARRTVPVGARSVGTGTAGGPVMSRITAPTVAAAAAQRALRGDTEGALQYLDDEFRKGRISPALWQEVSGQINNLFIEGNNVNRASDGLKSIASGQLDPQFREGASGRPGRQGGPSAGPRGRSPAEQASDFAGQSGDLERQALQAKLALATSAQERADLQRDLLSLERDQQIAAIEARDLAPEQKEALKAQVEAVLGTAAKYDEQGNIIASANRGLEGEIIARELETRRLQESQQLGEAKARGEMDALQNALALADTDKARKDIAVKIYDASVKIERMRLQEIIDGEAIGAVTKQEADLARQKLQDLNKNEPVERERVLRENETATERWLRLNINRTPGQINEAIDGIKIDGLESLNDGLTQAIMGAESLGDVFSRVADRIIADLLRIAIQQAIIKPLANALFGGGGGEGGGFFESLFAGLFADGGTIPTGQFGIVGEAGPEIAFAGPGGLGIMSNSDSRKLLGSGSSGGTNVSIPITIDATGADVAAIARLNSRLDQLQAELPGRIVTTVQDASNRRLISLGRG